MTDDRAAAAGDAGPEADRGRAAARILGAFTALFDAMSNDLRHDLMADLQALPDATIFEPRD